MKIDDAAVAVAAVTAGVDEDDAIARVGAVRDEDDDDDDDDDKDDKDDAGRMADVGECICNIGFGHSSSRAAVRRSTMARNSFHRAPAG